MIARHWLLLVLAFVVLTAAGNLLTPTPAGAMGQLRNEAPAVLPPGAVFRDCLDCPEMVVVPPGNYVMGAPLEEEERDRVPRRDRGRAEPLHAVLLEVSFAVGRFEITRGEFARFTAATSRPVNGCWTAINNEWKLFGDRSWRSPGFPQNDRDPAVCVSWDDARAYVAWLGQTTHQAYRLLSEAEWEYVARAGSITARPWGSEISRNFTPCAGCGSQWDNQRPAPVGSFSPNRFDVHDMLGNVSEWVADCWHDSYAGAPDNGTAWELAGAGKSCEARVFRGGSWQTPPFTVRSAHRDRDLPTVRTTAIGFRVARSINP